MTLVTVHAMDSKGPWGFTLGRQHHKSVEGGQKKVMWSVQWHFMWPKVSRCACMNRPRHTTAQVRSLDGFGCLQPHVKTAQRDIPGCSWRRCGCGSRRERAMRRSCDQVVQRERLTQKSLRVQSLGRTTVPKTSCSVGVQEQTMTMTMVHSEKSIQQSLEAWPHRRE